MEGLVVRTLAIALFTGGLTVLPGQATADVIAKAAIGNKSSELVIRGRSFDPSFVTLDLSLTSTFDNYFITFNNEFSIKDDVTSYTDPNDASLDGLIFYSREDINITLGYSFDFITVFGGLRTGETDAHYTANSSSFGTTSEGYYVGVSKSYYYKDAGALTGSIAIASLNGEVTLSEPLVDTSAFVIVTPPANIKGSALGLSVSIGWAGQMSEDTLYNIDLKMNQFDFEDDVVAGGVDLSYQENFTTLYLGLTHFF
jgi:hypothetical protein